MNDYQEVANIVGSAMGKAWEDIMRQLVQASGSSVVSLEGRTVNTSKIAGFVAQLGTAQLTINFGTAAASSRLEKGEVIQIVIGDEIRAAAMDGMVGAKAVSGSISIGINIGF